MRDGFFRVVVMGTFTSGKSTLINALLGSKILPESALPSTAILTFVQFGADADDMEIHFKDTVNADGSVTTGRTAWMEFIRKAVLNALWQWTIIQIMTGGWGIVVCGLIEWLQINNGKNEMIDRMLTESKNGALKEIRNRLDDRMHDMNNNIAIKGNEMKEQKCGTARQQLRDERARLADIERNLSDNNFNATQECLRTEHIISTMAAEINTCCLDVFGIPYAEELATI